MKIRLVALSVVTTLALVACADAKPTPDPTVAFCDSLKGVTTAVVDFKKLGPGSTIDDIKSAGEAVQTALKSLKSAAGTLATDQVAAIESAANDLQSAIQDVPGTDTVEQALQSLEPQVAALEQARAQAGQANCGEVAASQAVETAKAAAASAGAQVQASIDAAQSAAAGAVDAAQSAAAGAVDAAQSAAAGAVDAAQSAAAGAVDAVQSAAAGAVDAVQSPAP